MNILYILLGGLLCLSAPLGAQEVTSLHQGDAGGDQKVKRAWEIGAGASVFQFSRVDFSQFLNTGDQYQLGLQLRHSVIGPNLYVARELNPYFYLDLQGSVGFTRQYIDGEDKLRTLYMVGPGLQWRLGEYFESKYIDPFFRVGVSYMKKNFDMRYQGTEGEISQEMSWVLENFNNKHGVDRHEIEQLVLLACLTKEMKGGPPIENGTDKAMWIDDEARLFPEFTRSRLSLRFPSLGAPARGKPPTIVGIVDIVAQDEQNFAARIEDDTPAGLTMWEAVRVKGPFVSAHLSAKPERRWFTYASLSFALSRYAVEPTVRSRSWRVRSCAS